MDWKLKAIVQNIFSVLPFGEKLNYFSQINITRNLPLKELQIQEKLLLASKHTNSFKKYGQQPIKKAIFYEFGAGWDIVQPLLFYHLGIKHQILVDIRKLIKIELVCNALKIMQELNIILCTQTELMQLIKDKNTFILSLRDNFGINYKAPLDARDTKLDEKIIDCITSTNTLEHIPVQDIQAILKECYRILKDDGIMSFQIDYQDHYSYFDDTISVYNFLKFSDYNWGLFFNPSLHYQNRLRHKDYLEIMNDAGFEILSDKIRMSELLMVDIEKIKSIKLHEKFSNYSLTELAIRGSHIVLRKKNISN